ncbi:hypothetical protein ONZ45_g5647 [Pleurotus djamor]|nr:hypothetical protein ONZ45_g5647 [Pleurotus djamor]
MLISQLAYIIPVALVFGGLVDASPNFLGKDRSIILITINSPPTEAYYELTFSEAQTDAIGRNVYDYGCELPADYIPHKPGKSLSNPGRCWAACPLSNPIFKHWCYTNNGDSGSPKGCSSAAMCDYRWKCVSSCKFSGSYPVGQRGNHQAIS